MVLLESEQVRVGSGRVAGPRGCRAGLSLPFPLMLRRVRVSAVPDGADEAVPEVPHLGQRLHHSQEM